jgi:hypothetical protein
VFGAGQQAPGESESAYARAVMNVHREPLLKPYVELAIAFGASVERAQLDSKLELVTRAMRFAPLDVMTYRQALLLALAGSAEAAREQLERSLRAYPGERAAVVAELENLARRYPAEMTPLLKLATSKIADGRTSQSAK